MEKTIAQYKSAVDRCKTVFIQKNTDYGPSWRILRVSSLVDQLFIKAKRIRVIEEKQVQKVGDAIEEEYAAIINYSVMALLQLKQGAAEPGQEDTLSFEAIKEAYSKELDEAFDLMTRKNHDYGEVWRDMLISSYTDLILTKLLRIRQIIQNEGKTTISEGIDANLYDMINYAVFALIKIEEAHA